MQLNRHIIKGACPGSPEQSDSLLPSYGTTDLCLGLFIYLGLFFSLIFFLLELVSTRASFTSVSVLQWISSARHSTCHTGNAPCYEAYIAEELSNFVFQLLAPMNISPLRTRAVSSVPMVLTVGDFIHTQA